MRRALVAINDKVEEAVYFFENLLCVAICLAILVTAVLVPFELARYLWRNPEVLAAAMILAAAWFFYRGAKLRQS